MESTGRTETGRRDFSHTHTINKKSWLTDQRTGGIRGGRSPNENAGSGALSQGFLDPGWKGISVRRTGFRRSAAAWKWGNLRERSLSRPFRAACYFVWIDPGRCPGLRYFAPLGLQSEFAYFPFPPSAFRFPLFLQNHPVTCPWASLMTKTPALLAKWATMQGTRERRGLSGRKRTV